MRIVGVSFNKPERNRRWSESQQFGFELWSDVDRELALYYGAARSPSAMAPSRITVVLDPDGAVALQYVDGIDVGTHPEDVLNDCRRLFGGR